MPIWGKEPIESEADADRGDRPRGALWQRQPADVIAGPCQLEGRDHALRIARAMAEGLRGGGVRVMSLRQATTRPTDQPVGARGRGMDGRIGPFSPP